MVELNMRLRHIPDDKIAELGESAGIYDGPLGEEWAGEILRLRAAVRKCFSPEGLIELGMPAVESD